ncbi:hypothetical protein D3C80_1382330 [compost metagenome]
MSFDWCAKNDKINTNHQKCRQRHDLYKAEPELQFAKHLHRQQVHGKHDDQGTQSENPLVNARQPGNILLEEIHVERNGRYIGNRSHCPIQPIHPPHGKSHFLTVELTCVRHERTGAWAMHDKLTQCAQYQKCEKAA